MVDLGHFAVGKTAFTESDHLEELHQHFVGNRGGVEPLKGFTHHGHHRPLLLGSALDDFDRGVQVGEESVQDALFLEGNQVDVKIARELFDLHLWVRCPASFFEFVAQGKDVNVLRGDGK